MASHYPWHLPATSSSFFGEGARRPTTTNVLRARGRRVMDYIHANIDRELSVFDLAKLVQLSPRQSIRIFSNTFGTTPHRYVLNERVALAMELIAKGLLLTDIAANLGSASQSHFSDVFRKVTGMPPGRFRQAARVCRGPANPQERIPRLHDARHRCHFHAAKEHLEIEESAAPSLTKTPTKR